MQAGSNQSGTFLKMYPAPLLDAVQRNPVDRHVTTIQAGTRALSRVPRRRLASRIALAKTEVRAHQAIRLWPVIAHTELVQDDQRYRQYSCPDRQHDVFPVESGLRFKFLPEYVASDHERNTRRHKDEQERHGKHPPGGRRPGAVTVDKKPEKSCHGTKDNGGKQHGPEYPGDSEQQDIEEALFHKWLETNKGQATFYLTGTLHATRGDVFVIELVQLIY